MKITEIFSVCAPYIRKSRLLYSSIPTASFLKATYRGTSSSWRKNKENGKEKNIIQYIWRKYTEFLLSICYREHI